MARYKTLGSLLQDYRAEIGASGNAAHNASAREAQVRALQKAQELLWRKHAWPHLRVERRVSLQAGQRYYSAPEDLPVERIETIEVRYGQDWIPLCNGIGRANYSVFDSDLDQRSWPAERWVIYEGEMFEVWPVPTDDATPDLEGMLKITGIRALRPFVADDDVADLDDDLIVKFAATRALARQGAKDAGLVRDEFQRIETDLTGNFTKQKDFGLFQKADIAVRRPRGPWRVHYRET